MSGGQTDSGDAAGGGAFLYFGKRRWGVLLDFQGQIVSDTTGGLLGALTSGSTTVPSTADTEVTLLAAMSTVHVALVPSGRVWVRGGIGQGWITGGTTSAGVSSSGEGDSGLALSAGAGVSVWNHPFSGGSGRVSLDAQMQYLTVHLSGLRVSLPIFGIGVILAP